MTYIILKGCDLDAAMTTISLATAINRTHIKKATTHSVTRLSTSFKQQSQEQNCPECAVWHYLKHVKGLSFAEAVEVDQNVKTDKHLISTFGKNYCGVIDISNYRRIEEYCRAKVSWNALNTAESFIKKRLSYIEPEEYFGLISHTRQRKERLEEKISSYPSNMLRRDF